MCALSGGEEEPSGGGSDGVRTCSKRVSRRQYGSGGKFSQKSSVADLDPQKIVYPDPGS